MARYEYMRQTIDIIPQDISDGYQLIDKIKIDSSFVKYDRECMDFHRQEWLLKNHSRRGFQSTYTALVV